MRPWLVWPKLRYLPLAIGASVLVIPWICLPWSLVTREWTQLLHVRNEKEIAGAVHDTVPTLSLNTVLNTSYQRWMARLIGRLSPIFTPAVRWKNQLYYTLMGTAGSDRVVVGNHHQLLELSYMVEYCSRDLGQLRTKGEAWAASIRRMQDFFTARGKTFLYVITPSKVAMYPQILPDGYICPARMRDRTDKLKLYDEILARQGVLFVDTASYLAAVRDDFAISLFPRGRTHWNMLGAAIGTEKVIAGLNAQRREPLLATLGFTWRVSYGPQGTDRDLLDLMNLPYPNAHYAVPELTYYSIPPRTSCHSAAITEVGGSFLFILNSTLAKLDCPPVITFWVYWNFLPVDAQARRRSLLDAQAIIFEENDSMAPGSQHGELMMQEVAVLKSTTAVLAAPQSGSPQPPRPDMN